MQFYWKEYKDSINTKHRNTQILWDLFLNRKWYSLVMLFLNVFEMCVGHFATMSAQKGLLKSFKLLQSCGLLCGLTILTSTYWWTCLLYTSDAADDYLEV